jgi:hypothetical protein
MIKPLADDAFTASTNRTTSSRAVVPLLASYKLAKPRMSFKHYKN